MHSVSPLKFPWHIIQFFDAKHGGGPVIEYDFGRKKLETGNLQRRPPAAYGTNEVWHEYRRSHFEKILFTS